MGNDYMQHRVAVGTFYCCTHQLVMTPRCSTSNYFKMSLICFQASVCLLLIASVLDKNDQYMSIKLLLLLLCMDVHRNPGPDSITSSANNCHLDILHLNIRSIRHKLDFLKDISDDHDILCFSETHLDQNIEMSEVFIDGFNEPFRKDRNSSGGGVLIYLSNHLVARRRADLEFSTDETIWIEVQHKPHNFIVCCFYKPPTYSSTTFLSNFETSIDKALDSSSFLILCGDLNIDLLSCSNHQIKDILNLYSLRNVISEPTRITSTSQSLIDPIFISESCCLVESGTMPTESEVSDHKITYVSVKSNSGKTQPYYRTIWNYKRADWENLNTLIRNFDWNELFRESNSVDSACDKFTEVFFSLVRQCVPSKKVLIRPNDKPWFTSELRFNIRLRDRFRKVALRSNGPSDVSKYKTSKK